MEDIPWYQDNILHVLVFVIDYRSTFSIISYTVEYITRSELKTKINSYMQ